MTKKSTLGQAVPVSQGGFGGVFPGQFPVGVQVTGQCPSGWLPAPSAIIPGGFTCVRAPGSYVMAGRRR